MYTSCREELKLVSVMSNGSSIIFWNSCTFPDATNGGRPVARRKIVTPSAHTSAGKPECSSPEQTCADGQQTEHCEQHHNPAPWRLQAERTHTCYTSGAIKSGVPPALTSFCWKSLVLKPKSAIFTTPSSPTRRLWGWRKVVQNSKSWVS